MATLFYFPTSASSSYSHKHFFFSITPLPLKICRCPSPAIYASLSKKPRVRKKARSNEDVCNEIREFMSEFRFPQDHLPSFNDLSHRGRQDLAFIVRRRGYKLMKQLLASSININTVDNDLPAKDYKAAALSMNQQQDEVESSVEALHLSTQSPPITEDNSDGGITTATEFQLDVKSPTSLQSSTDSSLQEKVANFIHNGELNMIEDSVFDILAERVAQGGQPFFEFEDTTELESNSNQTNGAKALDRSDAFLSQQVEPSTSGSGTRKDLFATDDGLASADYNDDLDFETRKKENEVEISRLKFMLHQKELELSELKQQIEKEKLALSSLQSRAETELCTAQKLVVDKDAELHAAEEALSGLQEVQIQYEDVGESVEVAGSFNGWHQRIKMDPQPSSIPSIVEVMRRRSFALWRTVLWLYPGTYEIKFIVDGHWKTDPERESVTRGTIHNNILRVN